VRDGRTGEISQGATTTADCNTHSEKETGMQCYAMEELGAHCDQVKVENRISKYFFFQRLSPSIHSHPWMSLVGFDRAPSIRLIWNGKYRGLFDND
jgi:hypothetical protein